MPNDGCIYTCLIGHYDALIIPSVIREDYDYICYTDQSNLLQKRQIGPWEIRPLLFTKLDDTRNQRWHKILGYQKLKNYKYSVYIDNNINILSEYIYDTAKNSKKSLLIPKHFARDCIYDEVKACHYYGKESIVVLLSVHELLNRETMPQNYGLTENNLIFRNHGDLEMERLMMEWWEYVENYSKRDQLSLCLVLWKHHIIISDITIPNIRLDNINFRVYLHINGLTPISFINALIHEQYTPYQPAHVFIQMCKLLPMRGIKYMMSVLSSIM